jgi:putative hemolysin
MNLHGLAPLCIPVNKTGSQSRDFPRMVEAGFKADNHIIMFPAGLCSRRQNGVFKDLEWKKTFIVKSVETQRDVIPLHFEGRNSDFFYNLANVCKFLGIKVNIAMLYLADEMFKNRHKTFTLTIGKPIPWQTFDRSKTPSEWAQHVKDIVYKL